MPVPPDRPDAHEPGRPLETGRDPRLTVTVDAVFTLSGDLDRSVECDVTRRVALAAESADCIEIDARRVTFCDAAGVRALLLSKQHATDRGVRMSFRMARPGPVDRVLQMVGLTQLFA